MINDFLKTVKIAKIEVELDTYSASDLIRAYKESRAFRMFCFGCLCIQSFEDLCERIESLNLDDDE